MGIVKFFSRLPLPLLYLLSDLAYFVSYYLVRYRRKKVWQNLKNSFPEKSKHELQKIEKEFYVNLCDYAVEMLKLATISREELTRRMVFKDDRILQHYKAKGQSMLVLASHQFNWEWLLAAGNFSIPLDFVYQPLKNEFSDRFSLYCRTRFGSYAIKRSDVARETIKRKNLVRGIAIVSDQYPGLKTDKRYFTQFLNQQTAFFLGTNQLAMLAQYPVIFAEIRKMKRGYYEAVFTEIASPPFSKDDYTVLENYATAVESLVRENPAGWLWSHNRWKKKHERIKK